MFFWIITIAVTVLTTVLVFLPLLRHGAGGGAVENPDLQIYRDQLEEVERDLSRGLLSEEEAERTRTEISRRLLDADKQEQADQDLAPRAATIGMTVVVVAMLLAGTVGLYWWLGAPGTPDMGLAKRQAQLEEIRANRPSQAEAEAEAGDVPEMAEAADPAYRDLVAQLRETAGKRPDDIRGQQLLAEHEARLGRFSAARAAQERVIELKGDAVEARDFTDLAELMIIAANGYVSPEAERMLGRAITMDPTDSRARYYSGLDLAQNGRPDLTLRLWLQLLDEGPGDAPWIQPIKNQIRDVARMAGQRLPATLEAELSTPAPGPGPTAEQIENAQDMTEEERQQMIRSMVSRLSERLATEGGNASEWARLIGALGVLGETDRARAIWQEAQGIFGTDTIAMNELRAAATRAGVAE